MKSKVVVYFYEDFFGYTGVYKCYGFIDVLNWLEESEYGLTTGGLKQMVMLDKYLVCNG